jgi:hypothetical protein
MELSKQEWLDFLKLTLVDWLEQVEGAAVKPSSLFLWKVGDAYICLSMICVPKNERAVGSGSRTLIVERRTTYAVRKVMATEAQNTRHLVQPRTSPMSGTTAPALSALRAIGEDISLDLSPQPMNVECKVNS